MGDSDYELDFDVTDEWMKSVDDIPVPISDPPEEKHVDVIDPTPTMTQLVHQTDFASEVGATRGGGWKVQFNDPTDLRPFHEMSLTGSAPSVPQSLVHADAWCATMNASLELEYMSFRGNILCQCLTSFRPGLVDEQNQKIWDVVTKFAVLSQNVVIEVAKTQTKLNVTMQRLGSTAFRCSDQLHKNMDIFMAVQPFEKAVEDMKAQSMVLVAKNQMLKKDFANLEKELQDNLMGDVEIKSNAELLMQSGKEFTAAREKYLNKYRELNAELMKHKGFLTQLEQQLKDMQYTATLLKVHLELLHDQTKDAVQHNYEMAKKETMVNDYYYEKKRGGKVVSSYTIVEQAAAKSTATRSRKLEQLMRGDSQATQTKLEKHYDAIDKLKLAYTLEKEKKIEAEVLMKDSLIQLKRELDQKESDYDRNLKVLQASTEDTGVILKNLPLFLKAFQQIHCYNTEIQLATNMVLTRVQAISADLYTGLRGYKLWNKPLKDHKEFNGKFRPFVQVLYDEGIAECGELAPFHNDERQMERLMKLILPELRKNHKEFIDEEGGFKVTYENRFKRACKQIAETPGYLLKTTNDIGGYLGTSFKAFRKGQSLIKKPTAQTLQIELEQDLHLPGKAMLTIEDAPKDSPVDEHKHDSHYSHTPKPKETSASDRFVE